MSVTPMEDAERVQEEAAPLRRRIQEAVPERQGQDLRPEALEYALDRFPQEAWQVLGTCRWLRTGPNLTAGRRSAFERMCMACEATLHPLVFTDRYLLRMARGLLRCCPGPAEAPPFAAAAPARPVADATPAQALRRAASLARRAARFEGAEGEAPLSDGELAWCAGAVLQLARSFDQGGTAPAARGGAAGEVCSVEEQPDPDEVKVLWPLPSPAEALRARRADQTGLFSPVAFSRLRVLWGERPPEDGQVVDCEVLALFNLTKLWRWGDRQGVVHASVQSALCHLARVERTLIRGAAKYRHRGALLCLASAVRAQLLACPEDDGDFDALLRNTQAEVEKRLKRRRTLVRKKFRMESWLREQGESSASLRLAEVLAWNQEQEAIRAIDASRAEQKDQMEAEKLQVLQRFLPKLEELCVRQQKAQEVALEALEAFCSMELDGTMAGLMMLLLASFRREQLRFHRRLSLLAEAIDADQDPDARRAVRLAQSYGLSEEQRRLLPEALDLFRVAQCELARDAELLGGAYVVASVEALREAPSGELRRQLQQRVVNLRGALNERGERSRLLEEPWYLHRISQALGLP